MLRPLLLASLATTLALAAPASAQIVGDTVLISSTAFGDRLYVTEKLRSFEGPGRYQQLMEEQIVQELYRRDPHFPQTEAARQVFAFRDALKADRTSERDKYRAEPLGYADEAKRAFRVLSSLPGASGGLKAVTAAAGAVVEQLQASKLASGGDAADDTGLLTLSDVHRQYALTQQHAAAVALESRRLARAEGGAGFSGAADLIFAAQVNCSVRCTAQDLINSSPELRDMELMHGIIDASTGAIRDDIQTAAGEIKLQVGTLETLASREFASLHQEVADTRGDLVAIAAHQQDHNAEFTDFVERWKTDREYRLKQERMAEDKLKDTQNREILLQAGKSTIYLLSAVLGAYDAKLGQDMFTVGNSLIQLADTTNQAIALIAKGAEAFANPLSYLNMVSMTANVVGAVLPIIGLFSGEPAAPSPDQLILDEIRRTQEQIGALRTEMHDRFDRVDQGLNQVYVSLVEQFGRVDATLGRIQGDVGELKTNLARLQLSVDNLQHNMYAITGDIARRPLWHTIDEALNWDRIQPRFAMPGDRYLGFNSFLYTWATANARDAGALGPVPRASVDAGEMLGELTRYPLESNVNYFGQAAREAFGVELFNGATLVNPRDWALAARAYAQLALTRRDLASNTDPARLDAIIVQGRQLESNLARISRSPELFVRVLDHYRTTQTGVERALADTEARFLRDAGLRDSLLWGPNDQELPAEERLQPQSIVACSTGGELSVPVNGDGDRMLAPQLNLARRLGAGTARLCWTASWSDTRTTGTDANHTRRIVGRVQLRVIAEYASGGAAPVAARTLMHTSAIETLRGYWTREVDDSPRPRLEWVWKTNDSAIANARAQWSTGLRTAFEQAAVRTDHPTVLARVSADVEARQHELRQDLYRRVRSDLDASTALRDRARELGGAKALLTGLLQLGFSRALASDQVLAALTDGAAAILDDGGLRRLYDAAIADPSGPSAHGDLQARNTGRVDTLSERLGEYLAKVAAHEYSEHQPLLQSTLLDLETTRALVHGPWLDRSPTPEPPSAPLVPPSASIGLPNEPGPVGLPVRVRPTTPSHTRTPPRLAIGLRHSSRRSGTRTQFTRLTLTGVPRGATVRVDCRGGGCPVRVPRLATLRGRRLAPGARIRVMVTKPSHIGASLTLTVARRARPKLTTTCLTPGGTGTQHCPHGR